jgi:hypothetical protein
MKKRKRVYIIQVKKAKLSTYWYSDFLGHAGLVFFATEEKGRPKRYRVVGADNNGYGFMPASSGYPSPYIVFGSDAKVIGSILV